MKYCICPECKSRQEIHDKEVFDMIHKNSVKRFICDSCGYDAQVVAEKQGEGRVIIFFAMGEIMDDRAKYE
jgi:rubredoxin